MFQGHIFEITLLQEHRANILLEQCEFKNCSWSIFELDYSRLFMIQDQGSGAYLEYSPRLLTVQDHTVLVHMVLNHKVRPKSQNKASSVYLTCTIINTSIIEHLNINSWSHVFPVNSVNVAQMVVVRKINISF